MDLVCRLRITEHNKYKNKVSSTVDRSIYLRARDSTYVRCVSELIRIGNSILADHFVREDSGG